MLNIIIENDNLIAMQDLLPEYEGKIDVMPIDPPYNTDIAHIGYKDSGYTDGWVEFMRPRLEVHSHRRVRVFKPLDALLRDLRGAQFDVYDLEKDQSSL